MSASAANAAAASKKANEWAKKTLDVRTEQVIRLLPEVDTADRLALLRAFFTSSGLPVAEPDGNVLYAENYLPPMRLLYQRKPLSVTLDVPPVDGFKLVLWNAESVQPFGSLLRDQLHATSKDVVLFTRCVRLRKSSTESESANCPVPMLNAFCQERSGYTFVDERTGKRVRAQVTQTSAHMETGSPHERKTGFIVVRLV